MFSVAFVFILLFFRGRLFGFAQSLRLCCSGTRKWSGGWIWRFMISVIHRGPGVRWCRLVKQLLPGPGRQDVAWGGCLVALPLLAFFRWGIYLRSSGDLWQVGRGKAMRKAGTEVRKSKMILVVCNERENDRDNPTGSPGWIGMSRYWGIVSFGAIETMEWLSFLNIQS